MNYYSHNIGDYRRDTAHLSLLEHGVYRQLLDTYYLAEQKIPKETEVVFRRLCARTEEEKNAIISVLNEFFLFDEGWIHKRCEDGIYDYKNKARRAQDNGKLGGRPPKTKVVISGLSNETQEKANHKPLTINQEPLTNNIISPVPAQQDKPAKKTKVKSDSLDYSVWPELPDDQILKDWIAMRARKKANVSQTVLNAFGEQFRKAATFGYSVNDCLTSAIAGGWTGFKFEWMQNQQARASPPAVYGNPGLPMPVGARSTRDITLVENLNDRSWAK
jgi:uncharacterized protein YdaU (DUF1376 family)